MPSLIINRLRMRYISNSISVEVHENPSPSGDEWFEDAENMESVRQGIQEMNDGHGKAYTMDEIRKSLGV